MAVTQNSYTGNGSTTNYSFTFPYLKASDIKCSLDAVDTTAFTLANATTVQFNTAPANGAKIKIFRETGIDSLSATFYAGSAIKSEDLNDNFTQNLYVTQEVNGRYISALGGTMVGNLNMGEDTDIVFEGATDDGNDTTLSVVDPTANQTYRLPNNSAGTYNLISTGDTGTVATGMIANDAINGTKIADDSINSEHYVDGSIDTQHIADAQITTAKIANTNVTTGKIADDAVTNAKIANNAVDTAQIADGSVQHSKLDGDAVDGDNIADNSINSEHYVDGSIDSAHIASNAITNVKMADDSVGTAELQDSSVDTARLADNSVTLAKMTDNSVGTSELVDDAVTADKLANTSVTAGSYTAADITIDAQGRVTSASSGSIATSEITDAAVTTAKIAGANITDAKLASNSVTTSKITDANVTTVKIADSNVTLAKLASDLKQTTISDSDTQLPTSGAVVDYVAAQIAPIGGLEVIATEVAFPNTQPAAGVVISIADAGGIVVTNSGTSTTGRTVGGSTVTINNINSAFNGATVDAGVSFMVSSTGSGQVYNFHKATLKEADILNLSNDINDFGNRYRVFAGEPSSNNDEGDLVFDTTANKMKVYDGSSWGEVTSTGDFKYLFLCPAGGSGAPTLNGSIATYDLREGSNSGSAASVTSAAQLIVSINGVVQKANTGTSAPAEGFALVDANTIVFGANLASGDSVFIVQIGSAVSIPTPGDGTVTSAKIASGAVTAALIADGTITNSQISNSAAIDASKIANLATDSITEGNTKVEVVDAQGNSSYGVIKADLGYTDSGGSSSTESNFFHSARTGNLYLTEINQAHNGVNNSFRLNVGSTGGTGSFIVEKGPTNSVNTGIFSYDANSNAGAWTLSTGGIINFTTTQAYILPRTSIVPNTDSAIDLGLDGTRWRNAYVDTYYGDGSNLTGIASTTAGGAIYENSQTISTTHTIPTGSNGMSAGPVTVNNGITLTISSGSTYTIV